MLTSGRGKVVLFLPPYEGRVFGPPLGLLSLASSLREAGYEPCIIDGALCSDYLHAVEANLDGSIAFGVSLLTGPMILDAIAASRLVRRLNPGCQSYSVAGTLAWLRLKRSAKTSSTSLFVIRGRRRLSRYSIAYAPKAPCI